VRLNPATRTRSTVEVKVDADWHPAAWLAAATSSVVTVGGVSVTRWSRPARTTDYFCGPEATPSGATVLTLGRHLTKTRVTLGGDQLVAESTPIDVR
jgi:hypothetical protein